MVNHILVVKDAYEALRYKKKYPTLLKGVALFFPDELSPNNRRRKINTVYHTESFPATSSTLYNFPHCDGFVALSI